MQAILTRYGVFINKDEFIKKHGIKIYKKIQTDLYIKTLVDKNRNKFATANLLEQFKQNNSFIVPRFVGFKLESAKLVKIQNNIVSNHRIQFERKDTVPFSPTYNQKIIVEHLLKNIYTQEKIDAGSGGCVINLSAGQGKTYLAAYLCHIFNRQTLIIVPNETLLNQTVNVLKSLFPYKSIGAYYSKVKMIGDITVMIIDSSVITEKFKYYDLIEFNKNNFTCNDQILNKKIQDYLNSASSSTDIKNTDLVKLNYFNIDSKYKSKLKLYKKEENYIEFYKKFYFVIYDEIHEYCGRSNRVAFTRAQAPCVLGLTASPNERKDGFDRIARFYIGPLITCKEIENYKMDAFNFTSSYYPVIYDSPLEYSNSYESYNACLKEVMRDHYRTQLIINIAKLLLKENRNIFIFTERRAHSAILKLAMEMQSMDVFEINEDVEINDVETNENVETNDDDVETNENVETNDNEDEISDTEKYQEYGQVPEEIDFEDIEDTIYEDMVTKAEQIQKRKNAKNEEYSSSEEDEKIILDKSFEEHLVKSNFLENNKASVLIGGVTAESELVSEQNSKIIIATYHYLSTGRSIKKMDSIILAMPRKAKTLQTFGRIFRLNGDEKIHRKIYDIIDNKHLFKRQYYYRRNIAVQEYQSTVEEKIKVDFSEVAFDYPDHEKKMRQMHESIVTVK